MALDAGTQTLYSSVVQQYLYFEPSSLTIVRDRTSELPRGDALELPDYQTTVNLNNLAANSVSNITEQQMDDRQVTLNINRRRYWAFDIPDTAVAEDVAGASIISEALRLAGQTMRTDIDSYLVGAHEAGSDANQTPTNFNVKFEGATGSSQKVEFNTTAYREQLIQLIIDQAITADQRGWGMSRYVLLHPVTYGQIVKYFVIDKHNFGTGTLPDMAFMSAALTGLLGGFMPVKTLALGGATNSAGNDRQKLLFGETGQTLHYVGQHSQVESIRADRFFGNIVRGYYRVGAVVRENNRRLAIHQNFANN